MYYDYDLSPTAEGSNPVPGYTDDRERSTGTSLEIGIEARVTCWYLLVC